MMDVVTHSPRLAAILQLAELEDFSARFLEEDIDDKIIDELTDDDLRDLGLTLGEKKRFRQAYAKLTAQNDPQAPIVSRLAERRHLTVIFCDLVGSTRLAQRFDPEELRQIMTQYLNTAIGTMKQHGCYLSYTQGDGFMMYFGYPRAMEDDVERALRASLDTIAAVQALETSVPEGLNVRIGIATGMVVLGGLSSHSFGPQDFVVGETPNLAARLQSLANPGEAIVAAETWGLAKGSFAFEPRGKHALKGFDQDRDVYRVIAEKATASRFDAHHGHAVVDLVARKDDLSALTELWERAQEGNGQMAFVGGAAGIGKSRLIKSLSESIDARPLTLQCVPHLASSPLHPVRAELRRFSDRADGNEVAARAIADFVREASRLTDADLPLLLDLAGLETDAEVEPDALRKARKTLDAMMRALASMADARGTLLLVLEDVHWADATTIEVIEALVAALEGLPILFVLTHRPAYEPPEHYEAMGTFIDLSPLSDAEASQLAKRVAEPRNFPVLLIRQIVNKADGVPLYIEEMTKAVLAQLPEDAPITAQVLDALSIPTTLQDSLMSRLDRMEGARSIAQLGSVIGRSFTMPMLQAVAPEDTDPDAALIELMAAGLVLISNEGGTMTYTFNHALVQDTAYNSLLRDDREKLHLKIARALLESNKAFGSPSPDTVAHHCDHGGLKDEAVTHWIAAGGQALTRLANLPAISAFRAALRNIGTMGEGAERDGIELGVQMNVLPAYMAIYGWSADQVAETAARAMDLAHALGDGETLFAATFCRWTNFFVSGQMDRAMDMAQALDGMAGMTPDPAPNVLAARALCYTHYFRGELQACEQQVNRGLGLITPELDMAIMATTQSATSASLLAIQGCLLWQLGRFEEAEAARLKSIAESEALNHAPNLVYILGASSMYLPYAGEWDLLDVTMKEARRIADEEGFLYLHAMQDIYMGLAQAGQGEVTEGAVRVATYMDLVSNAGGNFTFPQNQIVVSELQIDKGDIEVAFERLEAVCQPGWERGETLNKSEYHRVRAKGLAAQGKQDQAIAEAEQAVQLAHDSGAVVLKKRAQEALDNLRAAGAT